MQIKVKLLGVTKPPVWRQPHLCAGARLDQLHKILQAVLGWQNYQMHVCSLAGEEFGIPDPELGFSDECQVTIGELITGVGDRFRNSFDFGDDGERARPLMLRRRFYPR